MDQTFYRQLFLKRYALLLQKVEQTYPAKVTPEVRQKLNERILCLTWIDPAVEKAMTYKAATIPFNQP